MVANDEIAQLVGAVIAGIVIVIGAVRGAKKSDGSPPPERPMPQNEVKEALAELRRIIARNREDNDDDHREMSRQLDRIETRLQITNEVQHWNEKTHPPR